MKALSRRRILSGSAAFVLAGTVGPLVPTSPARAQVETAIGAAEAFIGVANMLAKMFSSGGDGGMSDVLDAHFVLLQEILSQLNVVTDQLATIEAQIQSLRDYIGDLANVTAEKGYGVKVIAIFQGYIENTKVFVDKDTRSADDTRSYFRDIKQLYDNLQQGRREAAQLDHDKLHQVSMVICSALACELDMARALGRPIEEIGLIAKDYSDWFVAALDPNGPPRASILADSNQLLKGNAARLASIQGSRFGGALNGAANLLVGCDRQFLGSGAASATMDFEGVFVTMAPPSTNQGVTEYQADSGTQSGVYTRATCNALGCQPQPGFSNPQNFLNSKMTCDNAGSRNDLSSFEASAASEFQKWQLDIDGLNADLAKSAALQANVSACQEALSLVGKVRQITDAPYPDPLHN